ncbi:MAG: peptidase and subtilisin kexin sedolisin, partial [Dehalococcoidia bacterium]|nr:peptidase and subtilisin kexin sedolisin [Dehalococcoidia bacterium]
QPDVEGVPSGGKGAYAGGEVLVKFRSSVPQSYIGLLNGSIGALPLSVNSLTGVHTFKLPSGMTVDEAVDHYQKDPMVEWAEPNRWFRVLSPMPAPVIPNDTSFEERQKWYLDLIKAGDAWGIQRGRSEVIIAVLDSGVMCAHPDLAGKLWRNPREIEGNRIDDDRNGYVDDLFGYDFVGLETGSEMGTDQPGDGNPCVSVGDPSLGNGLDDDEDGTKDGGVFHGTAVAGVAAAATNNGLGVAGMCWNCKVMAVRVMNPEGGGRASDIAAGISYAAQMGARIINMSVGGDFSLAIQSAIAAAHDQFGAVIVAAAGNDGATPLAYPASDPKVIAVGATARSSPKSRATFSNWGSGTALTDVVAPGVDIAGPVVCSVALANEVSTCISGGAGAPRYASLAGTSFSAPLVSGLVGLLLSQNGSLTNDRVEEILKSTATPLASDSKAGPAWAGAGMIDSFKALTGLSGPGPTVTPGPGTTPTPVATPSLPILLGPQNGTMFADMKPTLEWQSAVGVTQYHLQVTPFKDDGPGIDLILSGESKYTVQPPQIGVGNYVLLPALTYTWRVRTSLSLRPLGVDDPGWSEWNSSTFRTVYPWSGTISPVTPANKTVVQNLTPSLQWKDANPRHFYFEVQVSKDPDFNTEPATAKTRVYWEIRHGGVTQPMNSYTIPQGFPLEPGLTYYWRVRVRVQGDGTPVAWSETWQFTTPPSTG